MALVFIHIDSSSDFLVKIPPSFLSFPILVWFPICILIVNLPLQTLLEEHEEDIEDWFFNHQASDTSEGTQASSSLENYLCREGRVLKNKKDTMCLDEVVEGKSTKKKRSKKTKGETGGAAKKEDKVHKEL